MSAAANRINIGTVSSSDGSAASSIPSQYNVLTISFNQDSTALTMGTVKAYSLFDINPKKSLDELHDFGIEPVVTTKYLPHEEVRIIERLFSSSLTVLVSDQAARKLNIFHYKKGSEIHSYKFPSTILAVKLNRSRLIVCLEESIRIFDIRNLVALHTICELPANSAGLCALSPNNDNAYLAYPGSSITGEIHIFDTNHLKSGVTINAHDSPLVAMSFDMSGARIATASKNGTVIRIHSPVDGSCLFEFRRGVRRAATIYSLAFSPDSMFLAASSSTETIHIFRLMKQQERPAEEANTWMDSFNRLAMNAAYFLPKQSSEVLTQDRSFATVHLQSPGVKTTIAMTTFNKKLILFVAGYDGVVSTYEVNTTEGGECSRIGQQLLFNVSLSSSDEPTNVGRNTFRESTGMYPPNLFKNDTGTIPNSSTKTNENTSQ